MEVLYNICNDFNLELECSEFIKSKGNDLIHFLVKNSRKEIYFNLLKEYLDVYPDKINIQNEIGWTPLMIASINSNTTSNFETVKYLLEQGADLNIKDKYGWTALKLASRYSNTTSTFKTVECLLKYNADPNLKNKIGDTALMYASQFSNTTSNIETVECLLEYGADPNIKDGAGLTALIISCINFDINVVELLLKNNVDPNIKDNKGWTALKHVSKHKHTETNTKIFELLLEYGADPNIKDRNGYNICDDFEYPQLLEKYKKCNEMCNKEHIISKITEFLKSL